LRNRRAAIAKQDEGQAMIDALYADEHHLSLPRHTAHRALRLAKDQIDEAHFLLAEGATAIQKTLRMTVT
jgi:hypothetical protein